MRSLSIVIPTFNEEATIESAIASALKQQPVEVIVSDGNSTDQTRDIVSRMRARDDRIALINEARGRGRQLAAGGRVACGDVLLFLHSDNRFQGDNQSQGNVHQQMNDAGVPVWGGFQQRIEDARWRFRLLELGNAIRVRWTSRVFGDQAIFVERSVYERVGGFAEVDLMEDVLLSAQLKRIAPAALLPGPLVVDARRWNSRGVIRQTLRNWCIQIAFAVGVSPVTLRKWYG